VAEQLRDKLLACIQVVRLASHIEYVTFAFDAGGDESQPVTYGRGFGVL